MMAHSLQKPCEKYEARIRNFKIDKIQKSTCSPSCVKKIFNSGEPSEEREARRARSEERGVQAARSEAREERGARRARSEERGDGGARSEASFSNTSAGISDVYL